jgi:prephenate dehydratase
MNKLLTNSAAIASERAAKLYGLQILKSGIEDAQNTITRYILLSKKPIAPERHLDPKSSLVVMLKNEVGTFFKALSCFALRGIQISKIESRPSSRSITLSKPWEYVVYIDFEGILDKFNSVRWSKGRFSQECCKESGRIRHFSSSAWVLSQICPSSTRIQ